MSNVLAKKLVSNYYACWNEQNFDSLENILSKDIHFTSSIGIVTHGIQEFIDYTKVILNAFPNLYHAAEMMVAEPNKVAVYVSYTGTHQGKLLDYEPCNQRIRYSGASFFMIENDKIHTIKVLGDRYELYKQITNANPHTAG